MTKKRFYDLLFEEAESALATAKEFKDEMGARDGNYLHYWGKANAMCEVLRTMQQHFDIKDARGLPVKIDKTLF